MSHLKVELDEHLEQFERRLPESVRGFAHWLRKPETGLVRVPLGIVLILFGVVGFLPIVGFWMVPLGLLLLAIDIAFMRPPLIKLLDWIERRWPAPKPPAASA